MVDLTNTDIVEIAVKISNEDEFKSDIFSGAYSEQEKPRHCKESWDESVENRARISLRAYDLEKNQQEAIIGVVCSVSRRMLIWIEYHVGTFNLPRDFCIEFLESSLFTPEGIIDCQKVATKMSGNAFSSLQDFQLASFYCQMERIPELFKNLLEEDKKLVYDANYPELIKQPDIIKFWSYYYMGDIDKLQGDVSKIDQYRLNTAVTSGAQVAVEYCLKIMNLKTKQSNEVDIAISVIKHRMQRELRSKESNSNCVTDLVVYRKQKYSCQKDSWAPDCFLIDIFYSLLSEMSESQKTDMLRKLFLAVKFEVLNLKSTAYVKGLDLFLCWPYQNQFLELLKLSWKHLPKRSYGGIILEILNRFEPEMGHFWYGEDKICDYRKLLMELWTSSPASFKRYIFGDKKRKFQNPDEPQGRVVIKEGKELLLKMFHLNNFTEDDRRNALIIIISATIDERIDFLLSPEGTMVCIMLIEEGKLDLFEELISICFESSEKARQFKKRFGFLKAKDVFLELVKDEKWDEAEETLKWSELTDEEMTILKKEIISCKDGKQTCRELCLTKTNAVDHFVRWCLPTEESIEEFRHSLLLADEGMNMCINFLKNGVTHLADKLVNWCLSSPDDINEFKKTIAFKTEISFNHDCDFDDLENISAEEFPNRIVDWKSSEILLSWCFKSESEVNSFKRKLLENSKESIILNCIELNKWDLADKFLSWLDLSPDEVKQVKKDQLFTSCSASDFFDDLMTSNENDPKFANSGGKQQAIECFLCWFLVDKESINEFTSRYRCYRTDSIIKIITEKLNQASL